MIGYIGRRLVQVVPLLFILSVIIFIVIQLPPGDYVTMYVQTMRMSGTEVSEAEIARMTNLYRLDKPLYEQYLIWIRNIVLYGDFGMSMQWSRPVSEVIGERLLITMVISLATLLFVYAVSIPIGIYSATHQYSIPDYLFTFLGFVGVSVPGFLLALIVLYLVFANTGVALTGLFSPEYADAPWSAGKLWDMLGRLWVPMLIIGLHGTASVIRVTRGMLLDELQKQYVITARAKGVAEGRLLFKYPVRIAMNPVISTIGWLLPYTISGETLVAVVLNLPTMGPVLLNALMAQDMYLAGGFLMATATLTVFGTLLSDILLAWLDPRIKFGGLAEDS